MINPKSRRLIVDTDLGLDDLVALAILRVQQCLIGSRSGGGDVDHEHHPRQHKQHQHRPPFFHIVGVTLTSGISLANTENASLLRRILPPGTPVYVSGWGAHHSTIDASPSSSSSSSSLLTPSHISRSHDRIKDDKPIWWTRTANRVSSFLSSLPHCHTPPSHSTNFEYNTTISAEQFIATNLDDANVDFLCLAPLSTVAKALQLRSSSSSSTRVSAPKALFYIMGGIQSDSRVTKRGESTSPFGYNDPINTQNGQNPHQEMLKERENFGEFNFALDCNAARTVLSAVPNVRLIPLESCTLVPASLRSNSEVGCDVSLLSLASVLKGIPPRDCDSASELHVARNNLRTLLHEFGTTETQWDSIAAAIYCNAFGNNDCSRDSFNSVSTKVGLCKRLDSREMELSDLGEVTFPTGQALDDEAPTATMQVFPNFTLENESVFMRYLTVLLQS